MAGVEEARKILKTLGMSPAQSNQMAGMTLLALRGLTPDAPWSAAERRRCTITKDIMNHLRDRYGAAHAPNTREIFRRRVLRQFVQAGVADRNPFDPGLATNSPKTRYAVTEPALEVVRAHGARNWDSAVRRFRREQDALVERRARDRNRRLIPVRLPDGRELRLSPGRHDEVQRAVVEEFGPRFAPGSRLLYLGDAAKKDLFVDGEGLAGLSVPITDHDKLPDVVLHDSGRGWLFLVEAVTSHGPVSPTRMADLEAMLAACPADVVYVSAFPDFAEFRKHMGNIAWETEAWIRDAPDHMIHYDGERFLGPCKKSGA